MMKKDKQPGGYSQGSQKEMDRKRNSSQGEEQKRNQGASHATEKGSSQFLPPVDLIIAIEHLQLYLIPLTSHWGFYCISHPCLNILHSGCV